ncbi:MAG: hypothetical protein KAI35_04210 [Desulfobulbaceae bacterium]|nr:hypothetical protein [Desulfobulbaceae bacterium]
MNKFTKHEFVLIVLTGFFVMWQATASQAQESKNSNQKNTSLYSTMLNYGEAAYQRGLHENAGYYFLQAVKANPSGIAYAWYESNAGTKEEGKSIIYPAPTVIQPPKLVDPLPAQEINTAGDIDVCARMIRAGREAFDRGKYLQARSFFQKAIQADVKNKKAWRWYNVTLSFALAKQSKNISYPDLVPSSPSTPLLDSAHPSPPAAVELTPGPTTDEYDEDEDMDGC